MWVPMELLHVGCLEITFVFCVSLVEHIDQTGTEVLVRVYGGS